MKITVRYENETTAGDKKLVRRTEIELDGVQKTDVLVLLRRIEETPLRRYDEGEGEE